MPHLQAAFEVAWNSRDALSHSNPFKLKKLFSYACLLTFFNQVFGGILKKISKGHELHVDNSWATGTSARRGAGATKHLQIAEASKAERRMSWTVYSSFPSTKHRAQKVLPPSPSNNLTK